MILQTQAAVDGAIRDIDNLRKQLGKRKQRQVRADDERALARATAQAWFKTHKPKVRDGIDVSAVDKMFAQLLNLADRNTSRERYINELRALRTLLLAHRTQVLTDADARPTHLMKPDFAALVADPKMRLILDRRWTETEICTAGGAFLAATVMMGGLLEALLLARVNHMGNAGEAFKTKACPKDKSGKPVSLKEWTLANYIDVGHELGWIGDLARDVSAVVRDYRNYIHPFKELSHGVSLGADDTRLMWVVSR